MIKYSNSTKALECSKKPATRCPLLIKARYPQALSPMDHWHRRATQPPLKGMYNISYDRRLIQYRRRLIISTSILVYIERVFPSKQEVTGVYSRYDQYIPIIISSPQPLLLWQNSHRKGIDDRPHDICTKHTYGTHNIQKNEISECGHSCFYATIKENSNFRGRYKRPLSNANPCD